MRRRRQFLSNIVGATSIEYSLIGAIVALSILLAVTTIGTRLSTKFYVPAVTALQ